MAFALDRARLQQRVGREVALVDPVALELLVGLAALSALVLGSVASAIGVALGVGMARGLSALFEVFDFTMPEMTTVIEPRTITSQPADSSKRTRTRLRKEKRELCPPTGVARGHSADLELNVANCRGITSSPSSQPTPIARVTERSTLT